MCVRKTFPKSMHLLILLSVALMGNYCQDKKTSKKKDGANNYDYTPYTGGGGYPYGNGGSGYIDIREVSTSGTNLQVVMGGNYNWQFVATASGGTATITGIQPQSGYSSGYNQGGIFNTGNYNNQFGNGFGTGPQVVGTDRVTFRPMSAADLQGSLIVSATANGGISDSRTFFWGNGFGQGGLMGGLLGGLMGGYNQGGLGGILVNLLPALFSGNFSFSNFLASLFGGGNYYTNGMIVTGSTNFYQDP